MVIILLIEIFFICFKVNYLRYFKYRLIVVKYNFYFLLFKEVIKVMKNV